MKIQRRDFFKIAGAGAATLAAANASAKSSEMKDFSQTYGVLVDTTVCVGCRKCEWACNKENNLTDQTSEHFEDKSVFDRHRRPDSEAYTVVNSVQNGHEPGKPEYMKVQCMHCNEPACVSSCIVGALQKDNKGPVTYDAWKCMGCRYCMVACPFQIPAYEYSNPLDPEVRKCTFCVERIVTEGKRPACVEICPEEALTFAPRDALLDFAHSQIKKYPDRYVNHVYGEHEAGGTCWMYLSGVDFNQTELPELAARPIPEITESIQHGIFKNFIPPIALFGFLGLMMHTFKNRKHKEDNPDDR